MQYRPELLNGLISASFMENYEFSKMLCADKANYRLPHTLSIHPTTHEEGPLPQCMWRPDTKAGDVVSDAN